MRTASLTRFYLDKLTGEFSTIAFGECKEGARISASDGPISCSSAIDATREFIVRKVNDFTACIDSTIFIFILFIVNAVIVNIFLNVSRSLLITIIITIIFFVAESTTIIIFITIVLLFVSVITTIIILITIMLVSATMDIISIITMVIASMEISVVKVAIGAVIGNIPIVATNFVIFTIYPHLVGSQANRKRTALKVISIQVIVKYILLTERKRGIPDNYNVK